MNTHKINVALFIFIIFSLNCEQVDKKENKNTKTVIKTAIECENILIELNKQQADTFGEIKSVPDDFGACLIQLDSLINDKLKEWIICLPDGEFSARVHHGFGRYLRNNWLLWGGSKLAKNLHEMGILHPDDMTGIILDSYQRKLKGDEIRIEEQIRKYQEAWMQIDSLK